MLGAAGLNGFGFVDAGKSYPSSGQLLHHLIQPLVVQLAAVAVHAGNQLAQALAQALHDGSLNKGDHGRIPFAGVG